jgi:hypothetical protein
MLKKTIIILVLSFAMILLAMSMVFGQKFQAKQIPLDQRRGPTPSAISGEKGFCVIQNDDGSIAYYFGSFGAGDGVAAYMDPATCSDPPPYPFRVTDAHFYLYDDGTGMVWPVQIQVNVRDLVGGDSCNGPGAILCSEVFTIPVDSSYGSLGRPMNLTISSLCCVNNPFFLEIVYTGGTGSPYPSPLFGSDVADTCNNWFLYGGIYYEWYDAWTPPTPGNIVLRATGNTHDPDCEEEEWPNHKMHFPQLPDLEGWDVLATLPKTLADDWQCSATGPVLDIHFWGSWKDLDGIPSTDDFPPGGQMPMFLLSIHRNIPADADTPWSRPGELVWEWYGEIPGIPFEPPAMEHWYDPNFDTSYCNDHIPYWRYDFVNIPAPFVQKKDSIYWLNVSAMNIPPPYQWGWKSSRDHFMDDAVWTDTPPVGPWQPMIEPPRCNWFDVYFNSTGYPQDMGSTNYYGHGWYYYEWFNWFNMWFYDNPFTYTQPKHVWMEFYIDPVGPTPSAQFAINWSTPAWDEMGMGRPPLPEDQPETLYIGRQEFPVSIGPNTIDFTLPYNPEWVSIDFRATDVVINGWIWHECIGTSMDLAFVITGEEVPPGRNHYKTWRIQPQTIPPTSVFVQDQFMEDNLTLTALDFLSNPVTKIVENDTSDIVSPNDHLTWYSAVGRDTLIRVGWVNQFQTEPIPVPIDSVKYLLVPTQKEPHDPPVGLDHYKCYRIAMPTGWMELNFTLQDQFDPIPEEITAISTPVYFCTPCQKNGEPMFDTVTHYVAYLISPQTTSSQSRLTVDQFGDHSILVQQSEMLLVPSKKTIFPPCNPPTIGCPADESQNQNGVYTTTTQWTADDGNPTDPSVELISVAVQPPLPPGISAANVNFVGPAPGPGLGVKSTFGTVTYTVNDHCQIGGPITLITTNNCPAPNNTATCTFNVVLTNNPPKITQPDSLEGFVNSTVQYDISGNDPNGDVINDAASITIVPSCGTYTITRTSGSGTSSGTWHVNWNTGGCAAGNYLVIHDLTDTCQATSYCTTKVHLSEETGWYWKPPYPDYAPNGMPDIDQKQDNWVKLPQQRFSFCGPVAVANCFKWFDSKYNVPPGAPGDGIDRFPLVRDYMDNLAPFIPPARDDHDPWNVNHAATPWGPPIGAPPPATPQPFVPGPQPQPSGMPAWGELVERLAWYFNTDGIQTGYCAFSGTKVMQMEQGIDLWFQSETLSVTPRVSTLADTLCEVTLKAPTFARVESLVEKSEDVILLLGFWYYEEGPGEQEFIRGDVDENGVVQMADVVRCMSGPPFSCDDAADVNDDGVWDAADCTYLLNWINGIGPPPPSPFPSCGVDPTQDALGCADFPPCPGGTGQWYRCGGHYVTVAGVNSENLLIAFSDPFFDNAETGGAGIVGNGTIIEHAPGHDATVHNDEGNISHDIYHVVEPSPSPGGVWMLPDYPVSLTPGYCYDFDSLNIPDEFLANSRPWNGVSPIFTEVEYAVHISPWDYRGDVNADGALDAADVVYLTNYLYIHGPVPIPTQWEGDVNCDGNVDAADVVYLINYLYIHGPRPCRVCDP